MTKYYFLIGAILYGIYGHSQDCEWTDFLDSHGSWSGNVDRFDPSQYGWKLQDSVAGTSILTRRLPSPASAMVFSFSLDFPPSSSNSLRVEFGLGSDHSADSSLVVLDIGESGQQDGLQTSYFVGNHLESQQEFWPGEYGEGASWASWIISLDETGFLIQNGRNGEIGVIDLGKDIRSEFSIRYITIRCQYTKTRSSHFTLHHLYQIPDLSQDQSVVGPGELFVSEYRYDDDVQRNFIELFNMIPNARCLSGLRLGIGEMDVVIPAVRVESGRHLLVVDTETSLPVDPDVNVIRVDFPEPEQNENLSILLYYYNRLLHGARFSTKEHDRGSSSMEMVDITKPCRTDNWKPSQTPNGSPGYDNGWFSTLDDPILTFYWKSDQTGILKFPFLNLEHTDPYDLLESNYTYELIDKNIWGEFDLNFVTGISPGDSLLLRVHGEFSACSLRGYEWDTTFVGFPPGIGEKDGLLITELMYEPPPGCPEYLEITNMGDMNTWWDGLKLQKNTATPVDIPEPGIWSALESRVFTTHRSSMLDCFEETPPGLVYEMDLFVLNNSGAELTLSTENPDYQVIDRISYDASAHNQLFDNTSGVALERNILGTQGNNWRSGFVQFGYRSPGFLPKWDLSRGFQVEFSTSTVYSISDREPKVLEIAVGSESLNGSMTIEIFDLNGRKIQTLANAVPLQGGEIFTWEGRTSNGRLLPEGLYLFWIYFYDLFGHRKIIKRTCVLSNK